MTLSDIGGTPGNALPRPTLVCIMVITRWVWIVLGLPSSMPWSPKWLPCTATQCWFQRATLVHTLCHNSMHDMVITWLGVIWTHYCCLFKLSNEVKGQSLVETLNNCTFPMLTFILFARYQAIFFYLVHHFFSDKYIELVEVGFKV